MAILNTIKFYQAKYLASWLRVFIILLIPILSACANSSGSVPESEPMSADQLVQSDINRVITLAMRDNLESITVLLEKLYKRNPKYWRIAGFESIEEAIQQGASLIQTGSIPAQLAGLKDIEVLSVALDPNYRGDRVAAFATGLANMIITAHGGETRFHLNNFVDAKKIYNAARNVEIAAWLLSTRTDKNGNLLLLSNAITDTTVNLSFERELGAIIGRLDLVASVQDESLRRVGINYLQGLLFFNFLPVR